MALEHAILVSLRERAASGSELTRRFDKSFGYFWSATHQQIYRTLARMEADGWIASTVVPQQGKPDTKVYDVADRGADVLAAWLVESTPTTPLRSDLGVKLRGASFAGNRDAVLDVVRGHLADHHLRLDVYRQMCKQQFPEPEQLRDADLDRYLVLRGGIRFEEGWIGWLTEYLTAHEMASSSSPSPAATPANDTAKDPR